MLQIIIYLLLLPILFGTVIKVYLKKEKIIGVLFLVEAIPYGFVFEFCYFSCINIIVMCVNGYFHWTVSIMRGMSLAFSIVGFFLLHHKRKTGVRICLRNVLSRNINYGLIVFLFLVLYKIMQVCLFQVFDFSDNKTYVSIANDLNQTDLYYHILDGDGSLLTDWKLMSSKYTLVSWYPYEAFLARVSEIHVTIVINNVMSIFLILLSYCVLFIWAKTLFSKRENRIYFMLFCALLCEFLLSEYSTFFFIWPTFGKCVLNIIILPLMVNELLFENSRSVALVTMICMAGCATSNMAFELAPISIGLSQLIQFVQKKDCKEILFGIIMLLPALIYIVMYFKW